MALPGLEEHSHPGARLLSQGYRFSHEVIPGEEGENPEISVVRAVHPDPAKPSWNHLQWMSDKTGRGEILQVEVNQEDERHQGVASAMLGVGRELAHIKPQHSPTRTPAGEGWARATAKRFGGRVPPRSEY